MDIPQNNKSQNTSNEMSSETIITNIISNYQHLERSIVEQLALSNKLHGPTTGTMREDIWLQLFDMIIPKKFVIEHSVFIIDSFGRVSGEVDLAIVDNMYTPYIFQYGRLKFIPIEAVAAVVECKSKNIDVESLQKWLDKLLCLETSCTSIARMANTLIVASSSPTQTSTRPIRILCCCDSSPTAIDKLKVLEIEKSDTCKKEPFDFVLIAKEKTNTIDVRLAPYTLQQWYQYLNHHNRNNPSDASKLDNIKMDNLSVTSNNQNVSLLTFNFQLNQLLMLINNPILFPHLSYAQLFNDLQKEDDQNHG